MQLKTVVLPAPFGPISAVISPWCAWKERSSMATRPPKRIVRCSTESSVSPRSAISTVALFDEVGGDALALLQEHRRGAPRDQAPRAPAHHQHHAEPEQ